MLEVLVYCIEILTLKMFVYQKKHLFVVFV